MNRLLAPTLLAPALFASVLPAPAAAASVEDHARIDRAVAEFTGRQVGEEGGARHPVDRRLRLASCPQAPALEWHGSARGSAQDSVLVRCPAAGWRVFVPVQRAAPVARVAETPAVQRGEAVAITVAGQGFTLSRQGEALDGGAVGDWIRVRPAGQKRAEPIRARILQPGRVGMMLP